MIIANQKEKIRKRTIEKQERIDLILDEPWVSIIYEESFNRNRQIVHSFTEFKDKWEKSNSTVSDRLKLLCDAGILTKTKKGEKGYVFSPKKMGNYISKFHDMSLIKDCPIDCIYSLTFPYDIGHETKWEISAMGITVYGLEQRNPHIDAIIESTYKRLKKYLNIEYRQKLDSIISNECKHIGQRKLKQLIKEWSSNLSKDIFLERMIHSIEPNRQTDNIPEKFEQEFKEITEKIWDQFNRVCPSIGLMIEV